MGKERELKRAILAGAAAAVKYLEKNKKATSDEAIKHVSTQMNEILMILYREG